MDFRLPQLFSLLKNHPFIACSLLLLFTPPIFPVVVFFSPLIISTALCVLAVLSFRPHPGGTAASTEPESPSNVSAGRLHREGTVMCPAEENLENAFMACKEEVTWLEWLHNEHSKELLVHKQEFSMSFPWEHDNARGGLSEEIISANAIVLTEEGQEEEEKEQKMSSPAKIIPSTPENAASPRHAEGKDVKHIHEQAKEQGEVNQIDAQVREHDDVRKIDEEEQSSLRFSFFQNNKLSADLAEQEAGKHHEDEGIIPADVGDDSQVGSHGGILPADVGDDSKVGSHGGILPVDVGDDSKVGSHGGILPADFVDDDKKVNSHGGILPVDVGAVDKVGSHGGILAVDVEVDDNKVSSHGVILPVDVGDDDNKVNSYGGILPVDHGDDKVGSHES